jgi:hypothetical protein
MLPIRQREGNLWPALDVVGKGFRLPLSPLTSQADPSRNATLAA